MNAYDAFCKGDTDLFAATFQVYGQGGAGTQKETGPDNAEDEGMDGGQGVFILLLLILAILGVQRWRLSVTTVWVEGVFLVQGVIAGLISLVDCVAATPCHAIFRGDALDPELGQGPSELTLEGAYLGPQKSDVSVEADSCPPWLAWQRREFGLWRRWKKF